MDNGKSRHTIWLPDQLWEKVKSSYREENCSTQNEFVEKALEYYIGHLHAEQSQSFLPQTISATLEDHLGAFGDRIGSLLFKLAVEQNLANNLLASDMKLNVATYERLRGHCVREVKSTNGRVTLKDAIQFQKSV